MPLPSLPAMPSVSDRVRALHARMTLEEKLAQLVGHWVDQGGEVVAPLQDEMAATGGVLEEVSAHGLGHLTRVYGTRPVDPVERAAWLWAEQRRLQRETRLGIPALVHEECLTGLAAWQAATFPTPLAWGAAFDPELVEEMGALIGASMRELGIHQGLAPVLDVIRDPRWGRVDECIAEDPYLVGTVGTAYVRGLQSAGVHATLKHFVGYSASQAGRNHAPVSMGPRELADVLLLPFEMAVLDGRVRSVMNSYAEIDGVPMGADAALLTGLLRERWGFDGVVVADYFAVAFLHLMHGVAADTGEAAALALAAGIDVELPTGDAYLAPLAERIRAGLVDEASSTGRCCGRWPRRRSSACSTRPSTSRRRRSTSTPRRTATSRAGWPRSRSCCWPTTGPCRSPARPGRPRAVAVIGPNADRAEALMGCYSFANHVLAHHPGTPLGFAIPTVLEALRAELPGADVVRRGLRRRGRRPVRLRRGGRPRGARGRRRRRRRRPGRPVRPRHRRGGLRHRATSSCPACSASWSRRSWPPGRPSSW